MTTDPTEALRDLVENWRHESHAELRHHLERLVYSECANDLDAVLRAAARPKGEEPA